MKLMCFEFALFSESLHILAKGRTF